MRGPLLCFACLLLLSCSTGYQDFEAAASVRLYSQRLNPTTGEVLSTTELGGLVPSAGASYLSWGSSEGEGSVIDGLAQITLVNIVKDVVHTDRECYSRADGLFVLVLSQAKESALLRPFAETASLLGGHHSLAVTSSSALKEDGSTLVNDTFVDSTSHPLIPGVKGGTWAAGSLGGLVEPQEGADGVSISFRQANTFSEVSGLGSLGASWLRYEGGSSFLIPFLSYDLDTSTGKTLRTLNAYRADGATGVATLLWSTPFSGNLDSPGLVDISTSAVVQRDGHDLVLLNSAGQVVVRQSLTDKEQDGQFVAGPGPGQGVLLAPSNPPQRGSLNAVEQHPRLSWYDQGLSKIWSKDLPDVGPVVAILKRPDVVVVVRVQAVGAATLTEAFAQSW